MYAIRSYYAADGATLAAIAPDTTVLPHPFHSAADLLRQCSQTQLTIAQLMRENERHWRSDTEIDARLLQP